MIYREFAARLQYVMTVKGLRNKDIVAGYKKYGQSISASTVSHFLAGRFAPTDDRVEILSKVLEVNPAWLQGYGSIEDVHELTVKEQLSALKRMRKIFTSLRPNLQRMVIGFMNYMEFVNQNDINIFQQEMNKANKGKNGWEYVVKQSISVSKSKK